MDVGRWVNNSPAWPRGFFRPIDGLQSIPRESNEKDVAAMLDELTIEANEESFVIVLQHGGNDVPWKRSIVGQLYGRKCFVVNLYELNFVAFDWLRILMHDHLLILTHITLTLDYVHDSVVSTASLKPRYEMCRSLHFQPIYVSWKMPSLN